MTCEVAKQRPAKVYPWDALESRCRNLGMPDLIDMNQVKEQPAR